jgi:hypothetical protein
MVIFIFIRKILKKIVMAFTSNNVRVNNVSEVEKSTSFINNNLTPEEIQLILVTLRNSTFKGEHVELFYNTVVKLQKQYTNQQK